jgi:hypothetical protein
MILPGHLNKLLEILPSSQILVVDLRPSVDYEKSHIHNAVNLRAPATFVKRAPYEMLERALADGSSRSTFSQWNTATCVVLYDKVVEFPWECPTAEALFQKFKSMGFSGQAFILKGHYFEFSASFDKYIGGQKMSAVARKYLESLEDRSSQKKVCVQEFSSLTMYTNLPQKENRRHYDDWLKLLEDEDRAYTTDPAMKAERTEATRQEQKKLEDELERQHPSLYRKALDLTPEANWDKKAQLVEPLARGLGKMEEAGRAEDDSKPGYPNKLQDQQAAEDYFVVDSDEEQLASDGPFQKGDKATDEAGQGGDHEKKGRGRNLFNKMLRTGR